MIRQRHEPAWPFLCVLVGLFFLAVSGPRAWQGMNDLSADDEINVLQSRAPRSLAAPGRQSRAGLFEALPLPTVDDAGVGLLAAETAGDLLAPEKRVDFLPAPAPSEPPRTLARGPVAVVAAPAPSLALNPFDGLDATEWIQPDALFPLRGEDEDDEGHEIEAPLDDVVESEVPAEEWLATESPVREPHPVAAPEDDASDAPDRIEPSPRWNSRWPEPVALFDQLEALGEASATASWAARVEQQLRQFDAAASSHSCRGALAAVHRLGDLCQEAYGIGRLLPDETALARLRATHHALARRLAVWEAVLAAGGPWTRIESPRQCDPKRLLACVARIRSLTRDSETGRQWQSYLGLDALERLAARRAHDDAGEHRRLARRILQRLIRPGMDDRQRAFVEQGPVAELRAELQVWADPPIELAVLLDRLEAYESSRLPSEARPLAEAVTGLVLSPRPELQEVGRRLEKHYRNANVRIAVAEALLDQLMPDREPDYHLVDEKVLGRPVRGQSVTYTEVGVRMIPDPSRLRLALEIRGRVSALTSSTSGPATFYNDSQSTYLALKEMELGTFGLRTRPVQVAVDNEIRLRAVHTSLDPIPIVNAVVRDIAESQHRKSRPEMTRDVQRKVAAKATRQIDDEADMRLGQLNARLHERLFQPLAKLSLGPKMIEASTTEQRMTMRLRLAADEQLAGDTPRPWAPSDSLASCQIHESALSNAVERLDLNGGTFTPAEVRQRLAEAFHRPEMLEDDPGRDDVTITFADEDAVRVHCRDGRLCIELSIARLARGSQRWDDFRVRAHYRPQFQGRSAELARDGIVELIGRARAEIALRTIFCKTFSKQNPWQVLPELVGTDPRFDNVEVTQFEIEDGWLAFALGPRRGPVVAQREAGKPSH